MKKRVEELEDFGTENQVSQENGGTVGTKPQISHGTEAGTETGTENLSILNTVLRLRSQGLSLRDIEKATGVSSKEITTIAGEMMRAGKSAEDNEVFKMFPDSPTLNSRCVFINKKWYRLGSSPVIRI